MNWITEFENENKDYTKLHIFINGIIKENLLTIINTITLQVENKTSLKLILRPNGIDFDFWKLEENLKEQNDNDPFEDLFNDTFLISNNKQFGFSSNKIQFLRFSYNNLFSKKEIQLDYDINGQTIGEEKYWYDTNIKLNIKDDEIINILRKDNSLSFMGYRNDKKYRVIIEQDVQKLLENLNFIVQSLKDIKIISKKTLTPIIIQFLKTNNLYNS
jgi:hypothetical protein